jgi:hypothetical protein
VFANAALVLALLASEPSATAKPARAKAERRKAAQPQPLSFSEFFELSDRELKPSEKLIALNGKRVRMIGYMADMERAPLGAFYLTPRPVFCDEAGGGTADLPPEAVRVIVRSAQGKKLRFDPRLLEVTGILEVGNRVEDDGQASTVRLILDKSESKRGNKRDIKQT